jgi:hypothetical protein
MRSTFARQRGGSVQPDWAGDALTATIAAPAVHAWAQRGLTAPLRSCVNAGMQMVVMRHATKSASHSAQRSRAGAAR